MKPLKRYYADFETTQPNENGEVRVYIWAIVCEDYEKSGTDIETFFEEIKNLGRCIIYFRNGGNFDFEFIVPYLIKNNMEFYPVVKNGKYYDIQLNDIHFRDSYNIVPVKLEELAKTFNKKYFKTSIDYNTPFEHIATPEEIAYCINDCRCDEEGTETFLKHLQELFEKNGWKKASEKVYKKMTFSGIAFEAFQESNKKYWMYCTKQNARYNDRYLRQALYGGFNYSNEQEIESDTFEMDDQNSSYVNIYANKPLPMGSGVFVEDEEILDRFDLKIYHVEMCFDLKPGFKPIIPLPKKMKTGNTEYLTTTNNLYYEYYITSVDFDQYKKYYDIDYKFIDGVGFWARTGMYKDFADALYPLKQDKSNPVISFIAKRLLNACFGKLALNPSNDIYDYVIKDNGLVSKEYSRTEYVETNCYLPAGIFIPAYARVETQNRAEEVGWDKVYYIDTDSVKYSNPNKKAYKKDKSKIGMWKDEGRPKIFKTLGCKKYIFYVDSPVKYVKSVCSGFTKLGIAKTLLETIGYTEEEAMKKIDPTEQNTIYVESYGEARKLIDAFKKDLTIECLQKKRVKNGCYLAKIKKSLI